MALAVCLGVSGSAATLAAGAETPDRQLRASVVSADGAFSEKDDPTAALWTRVPEQLVELTVAPAVHQSVALLQADAKQASTPLSLAVSAITDRRRVYFLLRWRDQTKDDQRKMGTYPDSAAIEIPLTQEETSYMMGLPDRPVAIWRWSAAGDSVEALLAGSPGTLTKTTSDTLHARGVHRRVSETGQSEWCVVFSHDLDADGDGWTRLRARKSFPVAFAVWQGSDSQRGGYKLVSNWISVGLEDVQ